MSSIRERNDSTEHRYVEERLSAYLDGQLSSREHKAVRQHLATCQECQWNLSTLQQTVQWTRALPTIPAPRVFVVPVPAQVVPAPRRRWGFAPLLQGATALVALLLVFILAGDFLLVGLRPVSAPQEAAMLEPAPAAVEVTKVVQEVEEEAVAEMAVPEPIPSTTPQTGGLTPEPAPAEPEQLLSEADQSTASGEQAVEKASMTETPLPVEEPAQAMAVEPPKGEEPEAEIARQAMEAPPTLLPEAAAAEDAVAAAAGEPATPTVVAELPPAEPLTVESPTAVLQAQAPAPQIPEPEGGWPIGTFQQPAASPLRLVEVGLAILVVFLGTLAILATILQRRRR